MLALGMFWCFLGFDEEITMYSLLGREEEEEEGVSEGEKRKNFN